MTYYKRYKDGVETEITEKEAVKMILNDDSIMDELTFNERWIPLQKGKVISCGMLEILKK